MKIEGDKIIFSSGKDREVKNGVIGICPYNKYGGGGYDFGFYEIEAWQDIEDKLSKEDLIELADHMIEQWQKFRSLMLEK